MRRCVWCLYRTVFWAKTYGGMLAWMTWPQKLSFQSPSFPLFHCICNLGVAERWCFWLNPASPISRQLLLKNIFFLSDLSHSRGLCNFRTWHFLGEPVKGGFVLLNFTGRMQLSLAGRNSVWVCYPKGWGGYVCMWGERGCLCRRRCIWSERQIVRSRKSTAWSLRSS